jgi:putative FmdB family regulatory protein
MPAYDYRCTSCKTTFEVVRQHASTSDESCPACGGATKRIFTPVGVVFKGSGFHTTDYRNSPPAKAESDSCSVAGSKESCSTCPAASTPE